MDAIKTIFTQVLTAVNQGHSLAFLTMVGLTALTDIGVPTFGLIDAVLLYVGYEFGPLSVRALIIIALLSLGRILGSSLIYLPSLIFSKSFVSWLEKHFPSLCAKITQAGDKLKGRHTLAIVIARFTPGLLTPSSVAAGILKIKYRSFLLGVVIHAVIADVILILIGYLGKYGITLAGIHPESWQVITIAIVLVLAGSAGVFLYYRLKERKKRKSCEPVIETNKDK
jgi:membrane protein DedA with SNARE-associated domain